MYSESPVPGPKVRDDDWGNGRFGARRGDKFHDGLDLIVVPTQPIYSMITGRVEKEEVCYGSDPKWTGIQVANQYIRTELWYMTPLPGLVGKMIMAGHLIGHAQDISLKYPPTEKIPTAMTPHLHLRVSLRAFTTIASGRYVSFEQYIDPALLLGV